VRELIQRGWVESAHDKVDQLRAVLSFFGVASPEAWHGIWKSTGRATAFRESRAHESDFGAVAAWLRAGEIEGRRQRCAQFDASRFRAALNTIRASTGEPPEAFCDVMREECAAAGVAVAFVQELPKLRVCGATRWLAPDKALIQLSLYYKRDDQFWFSFFHEAGHILLHGKREVFVDTNRVAKDVEEEEANSFAANWLLPPARYAEFVAAGNFTVPDIAGFAYDLGIAPGIVVGRLQHDGHIGFHSANQLRRRLDWVQPSAAAEQD
jgi:hypothetical protein